jgi:CheY-like chemotaxis protein
VQAQRISDLLDISRITSGKLQLERRSMRAAEVVEAALASIQATARAKRVTVVTDLDRELGPVWWDPSRFQQVVWNLVDNAVKFSSVGGVVTVRLRASGADVELEVTDAGQGISPEFLPHVFDRFRQEDATSRRGHGGLGLGLAIVHQLVTAHGGTITAQSGGEGRGARFVVRLPRLTEGATLPVGTLTSPSAHTSLAGYRVLVVDDNDDARALLTQLLESADARVADVPTADAALEAITSFQPHVIISDLAMPHRDGFDLIRQVRANGHSGADLPAIALSAFGRVEDHERAVQAGYQLHVAKPPDAEALLAAIARLVQTSNIA